MIEYTVKVYDDGDREWYFNDRLHREDGPAYEGKNGYKAWYLKGLRHRVDGPAIEYSNGTKVWYLNGELHRLDGPAYERDGNKEWYLNGKEYSEEEFLKQTQPVKEYSIAELEAILGHRVKVVK